MKKKGHVCCRVVAAVTNLPGPQDGSKSKVTELWLDKHRSPASISHPVHFGNTWLFLGALGPGKKKEEEEGAKGKEEGEPQERHCDRCAVRKIAVRSKVERERVVGRSRECGVNRKRVGRNDRLRGIRRIDLQKKDRPTVFSQI